MCSGDITVHQALATSLTLATPPLVLSLEVRFQTATLHPTTQCLTLTTRHTQSSTAAQNHFQVTTSSTYGSWQETKSLTT